MNFLSSKLPYQSLEVEDKIKELLDKNRAKIKAGGGAKKSRFSNYLQTQLKTMEEQQKAAADQKKGKKK